MGIKSENRFDLKLSNYLFMPLLFLQGVPIRIEIGPRDIKQGVFVMVRRDSGEKETLKETDLVSTLDKTLESIQSSLMV